jgi:hypothetical protein
MPTLSSEDIGAVLERFHKWAGNHAEPVRELTYEEAVKRSRRRVYDEEEPVSPEPAKAATPEPSPQPTAASQPATVGANAARPSPTSKGKSGKKAAVAQPGRSGPKAATRKVSRKVAAESIPASPATANTAVHQAEAEIVPPSAPHPSFEQILTAHIPMASTPPHAPASMHSIPPLPPDAPAVHLTVRLAAEERNAIRERAHDLGMTPAAYLRHCILEIDALRAELEAARLACAQVSAAGLTADAVALEGNSSLSLRRPAPRQYPSEGSWLKRLIRIILPGKAGRRTFSTSA